MQLLKDAPGEQPFKYLPLRRDSWVEPRITEGNFSRLGGINLDDAELAGRRRGLTVAQMQGLPAHELAPNLPTPAELRHIDPFSPMDAIAEEIRRYKTENKKDERSEARIYWDLHEAFNQFRTLIRDANYAGAFKDFEYDPGSNNFLFRGIDRRGRLLVSVIDQSPRRSRT